MRIIHDIESEATVLCGLSLQTAPRDAAKALGFNVQMTVYIGVGPDHREELHIHGSAKHIRKALLSALEQIDGAGDEWEGEDKLVAGWRG